MLSQDLFEAAPSNLGQDTLRQLQAIASSGQNADLKIGMEMMPIQSWQATYLMGVYKGIKQKYGVEKALSMLGNYDFVDHALARQEQKLANMSRMSSIPGERGVVEGSLNEFARGSNGDDDRGEDPYGRPEPKHYARSVDYFGRFEADHFDDEEFDKATGVFKGYWDDAEGRVQIAYFKFDNPARNGSDDPGMGWYYEPQNESVAEGGMPASVIKAKERIRLMSDAEKREYFKGKTKEELVAMARRHGYGAGSNVYAKYATEKQDISEETYTGDPVYIEGCNWNDVVKWLVKNIGPITRKSPNWSEGYEGRGWILYPASYSSTTGKMALQVSADTRLANKAALKAAIEKDCRADIDEASSENTSGENRAQLEKKLKELEAQLDPSFEFSDDHRYWKQQHEISQNIAAIKRKLAQDLDEEVRLPYPEGSEKLGLANMSIMIKAYNEPKSSRTTLSFGDKSIDLDREDVAAIADYYDDRLPSNDARWNFVRAVMSNYDNFVAMLHQIGRRSASSVRQPGLFQEAGKKKDDEELGAVKDVVLQRAISKAKADFPTAGSGLEALAQDFMRSQEQDKKEFAAIRSAEREHDQLLGQISKIDQEQQQDISDLEDQNSSLSQRLQQLQNVNTELEKKLSAMTGRRTQRKAAQPAASTSTASGTSLVSTRPKRAAQKPAKVKTQKSKSTAPVIRRPQPSPAISSVASQLAGPDSSMAQLPAPDGEEVLLPTFKRTVNPELTRGRETATDTEFREKPPAMATTETKRKTPEPDEVDYDDPRWDAMVKRVGQLAKSGPLKTVWDPEKRMYRVVPVSQLKKSMKEQEHDRRGFEEIKTVSDWAERLRVAKELQKDIKLMTDPEARAAVQQRIQGLMKHGLEKGYFK